MLDAKLRKQWVWMSSHLFDTSLVSKKGLIRNGIHLMSFFSRTKCSADWF